MIQEKTARYQILQPLDTVPPVRTFLVRDQCESDSRKVLTLLAKGAPAEQGRLPEDTVIFNRRRTIRHPLIPRILDVGFRGRRAGYITQLITARPLSQVLAGWRMRRRLKAAVDLTLLVAFLHRKGNTFGWITPSKIFCQDGSVSQVNLMFSPDPAQCRVPSPQSYRYCSPELLATGHATPFSDLYSLGMLLYFLLTGFEPFLDSSPEAVRLKQVAALPIPPRKLRVDLAEVAEEAIITLTRKNPGARGSLAEVTSSLAALSDGGPWHTPRLKAPLVGRDKELESLLETLLEFQREPSPRLIAVTGPSGIGKSFLAEYVSVAARLLGLNVFEISHHQSDGACEALQGTLVPKPAGAVVEASGVQEGGQISLVDRANRALAGICSEPMVIRASDFHWIDEGSYEVFRKVLTATRLPLYLLAECRSDEQSVFWTDLRRELMEAGKFSEIRLNALPKASMQELIRVLLQDDFPVTVLNRMVEDSSGNPFRLLALVEFLKDNGNLGYGPRGWYWCPLNGSRWDAPKSVSQGIRRRLRKLSMEQLESLRLLALMNRPTGMDQIGELLNLPPDHIMEVLGRLEELGFLTLTGTLSNPQAVLEHGWLSSVIRQELNAHERQRLQSRILGVLEARKAESGAALEELARHAIGSGNREAIARHTARAVQFLMESRLYRQASVLLEDSIAEGGLDLGDQEILKMHVKLLYLSGRLRECEKLIARADLDSPGGASVFLLSLLGRIQTLRGDLKTAGKSLRRAHRIASDTLEERSIEADLLSCLSRTRRRQEWGKLAVGLIRSKGHEQAEDGKVFRAEFDLFERCGLPLEAISRGYKAIRAAYRAQDYVAVGETLLDLQQSYLELGRPTQARSLLNQAAAIARQIGNAELLNQSGLQRARFARKEGLHNQAEALLVEVLERNLSGNRNPSIEFSAFLERALNAIPQFQFGKAVNYLATAENALPWSFMNPARAEIHLARGWLKMSLGHPEEAIELAQQAYQGSLPWTQPRALILSARAYIELGNWRTAQAQIQAALDRVRGFPSDHHLRLRLLQCRLALDRHQAEKARTYLAAARLHPQLFCFPPLAAEAFRLEALCLIEKGNAAGARTRAWRAVQLSHQSESPALLCRCLVVAGEAEAICRHFTEADSCLRRALEMLRQRRVLLPDAFHEPFWRAQIRPVEERLHRTVRVRQKHTPNRIARITEFIIALAATSAPIEVAGLLLDSIRVPLAISAGRIYLVHPVEGELTPSRSFGRTRFNPEELLQNEGSDHSEIRVKSEGGILRMAIPLTTESGEVAWAYLERSGDAVQEVEFDLIKSLKAASELALRKVAIQLGISGSRAGAEESSPIPELIGSHPSIRKVKGEIRRFAPSRGTVLITGESGTGKELVARAIHRLSPRRDQPFVPVNCATFSRDLIESELFGHVRGAFTGATDNKAGLFEAASGGTLFLDEISSMPLDLQPRLLRVLQEGEIRRLGETRERRVDVRVVAATNRDLVELTAQGFFRIDLLHRLNVLQIPLPPLRERLSDLPALCSHFLIELEAEEGVQVSITTAALERLRNHDFPGNVRELRNLLESQFLTARQGVITAQDVEFRLGSEVKRLNRRWPDELAAKVAAMAAGETSFAEAVQMPFMRRELSVRDLRRIVSKGLEACGGSYRLLVRYFGLKDSEYKNFLSFLSRYGCKVDFRPFRIKNKS